MCGNQISTVVQPSNSKDSAFIEQLRTQVPTKKIHLNKQQIKRAHATDFKRIQTHQVNELEMIRCEISPEALDELLLCDFSGLERLALNYNKIGPIGCRTLATVPTLGNLKSLELNSNKISDLGLKSLANAILPELEDLSLNDNGITVAGIASLKNFSSIQYLALSGNNLNDQGLSPITEINPKGFLFLGLSRNNFTDSSLRILVQMKTLEVLLMDRNKITMSKKQIAVPQKLFLFY